jgi:cyclopropane-fatty-acyl-phospholipid synthase
MAMPDSHDTQRGKRMSDLFAGYEGPGFSVRLWDGWRWCSMPTRTPICTIVIERPDAMFSLSGGTNEVSLGEAFINRHLDVEGDLLSAFPAVEYLIAKPRHLLQSAAESIFRNAVNLRRLLHHGASHSRSRDQASITYHYDLPVEFFRPWLGDTLAYSCAYFRAQDESLDLAQTQKLELVCRKLRLNEHDSFLDIGCGWGSLVLHAAAKHVASAQGITLSSKQAEFASNRIRQAGLAENCVVEHRDYRDLQQLSRTFDKIASVGMFEHVGLRNLHQYFSTVRSLMKPGGVFLNHGIARAQNSSARKSSFIDKYVFPDGRLVTLAQTIGAAESAGLEVRDVENLRDHYELTLRKWVEGLQKKREALLKLVPETTYRIWLLYTAGSAAAFRRGDIAVYQILLSRPDRGDSHLALTREDWYAQSKC